MVTPAGVITTGPGDSTRVTPRAAGPGIVHATLESAIPSDQAVACVAANSNRTGCAEPSAVSRAR